MRAPSHRCRHAWRCPSVAFVTAALLLGAPGAAHATWSVVAYDEKTGQAGVAIASCVAVPLLDGITAIAGTGAVVAQGRFHKRNHALVESELRDGASADDIIAAARKRATGDIAEQQYAAVTADGQVAAHSGSRLHPAADAITSRAMSMSAQGNLVESEDVVRATAEAYGRLADAPLADRLMAALAAGSDAGGDRRCNVGGVRQTAASAAIVVDDPDERDQWLRLAAYDTETRRNAVSMLAEDYVEWRSRELGADAPPAPAPLADLPTGDSKAAPVVRTPRQEAIRRAARSTFAVLGIAFAALLIWASLRWRARRGR